MFVPHKNVLATSQSEIIKPTGVTTPAFKEYRTSYTSLDKSKLTQLKLVADRAYKQNTVSDYVATAATIMSFIKGSTILYWSQAFSVISYAIKADPKPYETVSFCYDAYVYIDTHPPYTKVYTRFKESRTFNGDYYCIDWHPIDYPVAVSYHP